MKNKVMNCLIAAAALAAAAGTAAAQTYTAEVPMSFRAGHTLMFPGSYEVRVLRNSTISIKNLETYTTVFLLTGVKGDAPKAWVARGKPAIGFECVGANCSIRRMWTGEGQAAYQFPAGKVPAGEQRTANVTLRLVKGD